MKEERRQRRRDSFQNITIAVLTVSAVLLFTQTQLYALGRSLGDGSFSGWLIRQTASGTAGGDIAGSLTDIPSTVQVAVTGDYGRYGRMGLTTTSTEFSALGILLGEALGSSSDPIAITAETFQSQLNAMSVYYDFGEPKSLELLAGLTGSVPPEESSQMARSLLLSDDGAGNVMLSLWDGADSYTRRNTHVAAAVLTETVSQYELGNAVFAFEIAPELAPLTLLTTQVGSPPDLTVINGPADVDTLLSRMGFNPHSKFRYTEVSGTEVLVENNQSVHIATDGTVTYDGDGTLVIAAAGTIPTESEAALGGWKLMASLLEGQLGDAALYLQSVQQNGSDTTLTFGLLINELPILFQDGNAAVLQLSGCQVTSCMFHCHQYTSASTSASLLPSQQAAAIAQQRWPNCEPVICYTDDGSGMLSARWLAN